MIYDIVVNRADRPSGGAIFSVKNLKNRFRAKGDNFRQNPITFETLHLLPSDNANLLTTFPSKQKPIELPDKVRREGLLDNTYPTKLETLPRDAPEMLDQPRSQLPQQFSRSRPVTSLERLPAVETRLDELLLPLDLPATTAVHGPEPAFVVIEIVAEGQLGPGKHNQGLIHREYPLWQLSASALE